MEGHDILASDGPQFCVSKLALLVSALCQFVGPRLTWSLQQVHPQAAVVTKLTSKREKTAQVPNKYPTSTPFLLQMPIEMPRFWSRVLGYLWFLKRKETLFLFKNKHKYPCKYPTQKSQFYIEKTTLWLTSGGYLCGFSRVGALKQVTLRFSHAS
jgi:hypothetical protein